MKFEIKRLDVYRKVPQDLTEPTLTGAVISLLCIVLIISLLVVELNSYLSPELVSELFVESDDSSRDRISVLLNISLLRLKCDVAGLDIQDSNGRHEVGFIENTAKVSIHDGLGCRMETQFFINKVPGNFHVSTHSAKRQPDTVDMAHVIHSLRFGESLSEIEIARMARMNGAFETLSQKDNSANTKLESHEYHLKIVPSIYESRSLDRKYLYQYTYAYKSYTSISFGTHIPAIWFRYDLSPITIRYSIRDKNLYTFITILFGIIGGTFTVAGIISSLIFTTSNLFKKLQIGKLS